MNSMSKNLLLIFTLFCFSCHTNVMLSFRCQTPVTLSAPWQDASLQQIAVSRNGDAIAVWQRFDGDYVRIQASHYDSTTNSWSSIENVATISPSNQNNEIPQVAINSSGDGFATWRRFDGVGWRIQISQYNATSKSWTEPLVNVPVFSPANLVADAPQIDINDNGRAVAAWQIYTGTKSQIQVALYNGFTWGITNLFSLFNNNAYAPTVTIDPAGNSIITWYESDGVNWRINWIRFIQSSFDAWGTLSVAGSNSYMPQIKSDAQGNAIVAWQITDGELMIDEGFTWTVQAAYYDEASSTWFPEIKNLEENIDLEAWSRYPFVHVDMNQSGTALFTWYIGDNGSQLVRSTHYDGSSWSSWTPSAPTTLSHDITPINDTDWPEPQVAINDTGKGTAVWNEYDSDGKERVLASFFDGANWLSPGNSVILSQSCQSAHAPKVGMDSNSNSLIVWNRTDGTNKSSQPSGILRIQSTKCTT